MAWSTLALWAKMSGLLAAFLTPSRFYPAWAGLSRSTGLWPGRWLDRIIHLGCMNPPLQSDAWWKHNKTQASVLRCVFRCMHATQIQQSCWPLDTWIIYELEKYTWKLFLFWIRDRWMLSYIKCSSISVPWEKFYNSPISVPWEKFYDSHPVSDSTKLTWRLFLNNRLPS